MILFFGAPMTIVSNYIAICLAAMASVSLIGAPKLTWLVSAAAFAIAVIGVPHGGLDHWTGRRILAPLFAQRWWLVFFPSYLVVALMVALAWIQFPVATIVLFFIVSAWHFGHQDHRGQSTQTAARLQWLIVHASAVAVGGLAIWIPALIRAEEMVQLLKLIIRPIGYAAAEHVVVWTQCLACVCLPWAAVVIGMRTAENPGELREWVPLFTAMLAATTPILLAFSIYFCAWHSLEGLLDLQRQERLGTKKFLSSVLPMSATAVIAISLTGYCFRDAEASIESGMLPATLQTLFIGLAAIAVPHLVLHAMADWLSRSKPLGRIPA